MSNYNPQLNSPLRDVSRSLAAGADAKTNGNGIAANGVIGKDVRENLFASISNTSHPLAAGSGAGAVGATSYHHDISAHQHNAMTRSLSHRNISAGQSHPVSPIASRPDSPYTVNPPIDFDGLSWPSVGAKARKEETPEEQGARMEKLSGA